MSGTYFVDPRFLEVFGSVTLANVQDYFKQHPSYDRNCINEKGGSAGVNYKFTQIHEGYILITKEAVTDDKHTALEHYMAVNEKVFDCANIKDLMAAKTANLIALVRDFQQCIVDSAND